MTHRARHTATLLCLLLVVVGCVPTPARLRSASLASTAPGVPAATPTELVTPSPTGPTPPSSFIRPTPTPLPTFFVHVVRSGDTLSSIASTYATTRLSIAFWNRSAYPSLDPESPEYRPNRIVVGWMLRLIPNLAIDEEELLQPTPSQPTPSSS
ncbi:MAG: LysM domain-containing protein [Candidatus Limnocylindrales bacterium]